MKIDIRALVVGAGCPQAKAEILLPVVQSVLDEYGVLSYRQVAAFLANIGVESNGLTVAVESLNYSADRMAAVWPARYALQPVSKPPRPNATAVRLAYNPQALANNVYAGRLGNGDEASGDGWRYRGRGWMQVTGRYNYKTIGNRLGVDLESNPEKMEEALIAARSAGSFWIVAGCNELADKDMFSQTVKQINGKLPCEENHGPLRLQRYKDCVKLLKSM